MYKIPLFSSTLDMQVFLVSFYKIVFVCVLSFHNATIGVLPRILNQKQQILI